MFENASRGKLEATTLFASVHDTRKAEKSITSVEMMEAFNWSLRWKEEEPMALDWGVETPLWRDWGVPAEQEIQMLFDQIEKHLLLQGITKIMQYLVFSWKKKTCSVFFKHVF